MPANDPALHLLDTRHPSFGWPLLRALAAAELPVALLGPTGSVALAERSAPGLRVVCCASAPSGSVRSAAIALHRGLDRAGERSPVVVAWSDRAERVARHPLSGTGNVLSAPARLLSPPPCAGQPFGGSGRVSYGSGGRISREDLDIADGETVLVALGGPSGSVDAFAFSYLAGVLSFAGVPIVTVVPPHAASIDRALRFVERHDHAWRSVIAEYDLPEVIGIGDIAAYLPPARPVETAAAAAPSLKSEIGWGLGVGVPMIVQAETPIWAMLGGLAEHGSRVLSVPAGEPGLETVRIVEAALAMGRGEPVDHRPEFEDWAAGVRSLGSASAHAV